MLMLESYTIASSCDEAARTQVVVNYVAMTPEGRIFDNSLAKNAPYYIRVGTAQAGSKP